MLKILYEPCTGSKKHVDSICVHSQILKYLSNNISNCAWPRIAFLVKENPKIHFQNIHVNVDND